MKECQKIIMQIDQNYADNIIETDLAKKFRISPHDADGSPPQRARNYRDKLVQFRTTV